MFDRPLAKGSIAASPQPPKMPKVVFPGGYLYIYIFDTQIHISKFLLFYFGVASTVVELLV